MADLPSQPPFARTRFGATGEAVSVAVSPRDLADEGSGQRRNLGLLSIAECLWTSSCLPACLVLGIARRCTRRCQLATDQNSQLCCPGTADFENWYCFEKREGLHRIVKNRQR